MRSIMVLILVFVLCTANCKAQGAYFKQNLEQASIDELNQYLKRAKDRKRTGFIMMAGGPILTVAGVLLMERNYVQGSVREDGHTGSANGFTAGALLFVGGVASTIVSVPIVMTNFMRTRRIKNVIMNRSSAEISLSPGLDYNKTMQNLNTDITLRIRF